jgi:hypothetical protein
MLDRGMMTRDKDQLTLLTRNLCCLLRYGMVSKDQVANTLIDVLGLYREPIITNRVLQNR